MEAFQPWLVDTLRSVKPVAHLMRTHWAWPICESLHFLGLSMLIGAIGTFDLRLMGIGKKIPIAELHRVIPWGIAGYVLNICTGLMFLMTEPDQYIYNPSFHFKILFMTVAGLNVLAFYSVVFWKVRVLPPGVSTPLSAKLIGAVSLSMWIGVIIAGRMLTFYRPGICMTAALSFPFYCVPQ
ncbi:MAG: hypothetical protein LAO55_06490 [Acidobacteriia bacterium]|nr:hypothetical protein [Terriglobia bacterium]